MRSTLILLFLINILVAKPALSVLYFENRSEDTVATDFSKALADIVSVELTKQDQFDIVEREELEKVVNEQQFSRTSFVDPTTAIEVGKILGASYLFSGAYLVEGDEIIITMKMVKVKDGKMVSGDRINGKKGSFGKLISSITKGAVAMLEQEGHNLKVKVQLENINYQDVYKYNQLLAMKDRGELEKARKELRKLSMNLYAAERALIKIEKEIEKAVKERKKVIDKIEKENMTYMQFITLINEYMIKQQYQKVYELCDKQRGKNFADSATMVINGPEFVEQYAITAANSMRNWQVVIADGTAFMKTFPSSMYFPGIKMQVKAAIQQIEQEKASLASMDTSIDSIKALGFTEEVSNYHIGLLYYEKQLYSEALPFLQKGNLSQSDSPAYTEARRHMDLILCHYHLKDMKAAKELYAQMVKKYPHSPYIQSLSGIINYLKTIE